MQGDHEGFGFRILNFGFAPTKLSVPVQNTRI